MLELILKVTIVLFLLSLACCFTFWTWKFIVPFFASALLLGAVFGVHKLEDMLT